MRGTRWLLLLATFFAPVLMVSAAAPVGTTSSSGSGHPPPEPPNVRLIASDASGVTIELNYEAPQIERLDEPVGRVRVTVRRAVPSARLGYPELPVDRITLGVPHGAKVRPRAIPGPSKDIGRYRVVPTPHAEIITDPSGAQVAQPIFVEAPEAYGVRGFRPSALAEVVSDGLMRDRRTVTVEVRPVQWDASTRRLRAYSRITLRVDFVGAPAPARVRSPESEAFTGYFGRHLINDEVARAWRAPAAPADSIDEFNPPPLPPLAMKLFTSRDSVIRVYGREIAEYGVDIAAVSPANLSVTTLGDEAPIYVHGDRDGRFDPDDYVEFLATRPTTPYSRWNVYRLAEGDTPGLRVAGVEGAPRNGLATLVPNFRSKIHFEENLTHSLLQTATTSAVSPGDPHHWYEARDHWFWFGVKNGVERNEAELKFPLFDVATTFDLGRIDVMLQGGTPVDHDFILSLNEVKVGRVQWIDQREQSLGRSVRIEDLVDAADGMNTMRLIRVDSNEDDDTDKYPYRASVNYFDLEYTRDFRAAGDVLFAATPPSNKDLETRRRRTLEYSISDFVADDIAIYEHNGKNLVSRLRNVEVEARPLTPDTRDRLLAVQAALGQPLSSPATLYTARFQAQDTHDAKYVAVSTHGVVAPDRIELDEPSNLRNPAAGADYILIYHRKFAAAAKRLVAWRRTPEGGDLRAKAIEISDVYDEFSHGMTTPWAIKDYLRYVYVNYKAPALSYVTILADATYDLFGVDEELYDDAPEVMGYIPTHYVWTLFGQTASDHWFTTVSGIDPLPDFFLGRIPVETAEEADATVAKILKYEGRPRNGSWRRQIISVADDDTTLSGDFIFKKSLTEVSQNHTLLGYVTNKIFLEDILNEFEEGAAGRVRDASRLARQRIVDSLSEGALIAQYAGHGGRLVWAHEIIFDNSGIRTLRETDRLSLMFVLSCNNGYFDAPAEPSMGELLLRLDKAGIIGMVAATRLTFGSGNDALNKLIFDDIFGRNVRSFGEIAFHPKTRLMVEEGLSHLEVMQQYSLFGDPATKLHIADYEIRPEIQNRSVTPGGTITTEPGQILKSEYVREIDAKTFTPVSDFTGRLFVTAQFTQRGSGRVIERGAEATVTNGRYPSVSLDVPPNSEPGRAQIEFFAEADEFVAVGGATFALSEPVIEDVAVEETGGAVSVAVRVTDDEGIDRMELEHYDEDAREWVITPLRRDASRGAGWYSLAEPLPMPPPGEGFEYFVRAVDTDGTQVETRVATKVFQPIPDWRILRSELDRTALISYKFDETLGWHIALTLENTEDAETTTPVSVVIYEGNPDMDRDDIPDANAAVIGTMTVTPDAWVKADPLVHEPTDDARLRDTDTPLNTNWLAAGTLRHTLDPGTHLLFAWVDPPSRDGSPTLDETDVRDNVDSAPIQVTAARVQGASVAIESLDGALRVDISGRAFTSPVIVTTQAITPAPVGQLALTALPPLGDTPAHGVTTVDAESGPELAAPATVEARFDLTDFRSALALRIGGEDGAAVVAPEVVRNELSGVGIYEWRDDIARWRRLPESALLVDAQQNLVTRTGFTRAEVPEFDANVTAVVAVADSVEEGRWIAFFTDPFNYDLYRENADGTLERRAERVPMVPPTAPIPTDRHQYPHVATVSNDDPRSYGDVLRMDVNLPGQGAPAELGHTRMGNSGRGVLQMLDVGTAGEDVWTLLFLDETTFEVRRRSYDIATVRPDAQFGTVGETWTDPATGVQLRVLAGETLYGFGDSIRFSSHELGVLRGTTDRLGVFAAFATTDVTPPAVEFAVAGQDFADGDPVSPSPEFHATISDDSGVHPEDVTIELSANGADFAPVAAEDLRLHVARDTSQVLLNYRPTLDPADYLLRATILDLDGNRVIREVGFRVTTNSILRSVLNYPNPFRSHTDIGIEATGEMDTLTVTVYSLQGRVVWRAEHPSTAGFVRIRWDGRDSEGRDVANGVYYAKVAMTARGQTHTDVLKMLKMK